MPAEETPISPQDIYARTTEGSAAMDDVARPLSSGFREMLKAIDGKLTVEKLTAKFPRLDEEDITSWLRELLRTKLIDFAEVPFELPELKAVKPSAQAPNVTAQAPAAAAQAPNAAMQGAKPASADEFDIATMAANVEQWLRQDTESFGKVAKADLSATIQSAALQSTQALATLQDSGFFANLIQPLRRPERRRRLSRKRRCARRRRVRRLPARAWPLCSKAIRPIPPCLPAFSMPPAIRRSYALRASSWCCCSTSRRRRR